MDTCAISSMAWSPCSRISPYSSRYPVDNLAEVPYRCVGRSPGSDTARASACGPTPLYAVSASEAWLMGDEGNNGYHDPSCMPRRASTMPRASEVESAWWRPSWRHGHHASGKASRRRLPDGSESHDVGLVFLAAWLVPPAWRSWWRAECRCNPVSILR